MQVFVNPLHAQHQGRHEMFRGRLVPCVEVPDRVEHVRAELVLRGIGRFAAPTPANDALLHKLHTPRYLQFLQTAWNDWLALDPANAAFDLLPSVWPAPGMRRDPLPKELSARVGLFAFDAGSPITAGTWAAARAGADCAVSAAHALVAGEPCAFALTRPPGHHAGGPAAEATAEKVKGALSKLQAIPRAGLPDDIASAALFLAGDESGFITAEDIIVDGGLIAGRRYAEVLAGGSVWKSAIG